MSADVIHDAAGRRFFAEVEGREVVMSYADVDESTVDFQSTFTPPELRGRGLAAQVVGAALAWARNANKRVIPSCWYVREYLEKERK